MNDDQGNPNRLFEISPRHGYWILLYSMKNRWAAYSMVFGIIRKNEEKIQLEI